MRLATYNVENLFNRAKAMNQGSWAKGKPILERFAALSALLGEQTYTAAMKQRMQKLMVELGLEKSDTGPFVMLRRNRGRLIKRPKSGGLEIVAEGRADWVGSLELRDEPIDEIAMRNTARVMLDVQADVLAIIEAESRPALVAFNQEIVGTLGDTSFRHVMLIDGNDDRGIDVGLMTRQGFAIGPMRSHVDDRDTDGQFIFSRDCPEFSIETPGDESLIVLVNHFKSKGYGSQTSSDTKRQAQAARVKAIYEDLVARGERHIAVVGDFNDTPDSAPLVPLLQDSDLRDVFTHERFEDSGYPGTYGLCNAANKIDYLLLSPALFERVRAGGVFRQGMWPGSRPRRWDAYPEIQKADQAGSDHAAVWVDLDL